MPYDPFRHHRRSVRLRGHDYAAQGTYFITICAAARECLFGQIVGGRMRLNELGDIAATALEETATIRPTLRLGSFVIMPNHIHCLVTLTRSYSRQGALLRAPTNDAIPRRADRAIGAFVGAYKGAVTRRINSLRDASGTPVWQRNYYEHVVRNGDDFRRIVAYIRDNPSRWTDDEYHPDSLT